MDESLLLRAFRRAAERPWYRTLLAEHGVPADAVADDASFVRLAPVLSKASTFQRFSIAELCGGTPVASLATVLTSSGHGGVFSFGVSTRAQEEAAPELIDDALDAAFAVRSRATLVINCLPMGVVFSSRAATVATTSVREDMAVALVEHFGGEYEQIVIVADPLFLKRLLDYAASRGVDWQRHRVSVVIGEETFGEHYRSYVASCLGLDPERPERGWIMSSFGVGELGLHLLFETPATVALRRMLRSSPRLAAAIGLGAAEGTTPTILAYRPTRTFLEVLDPDGNGYGRLAVTMLDDTLPIPLPRYTTGDRARLLDDGIVAAALASHGVGLPAPLPAHLVALVGRERDVLPNGVPVEAYKDALYADAAIARDLTGACRLVTDDDGLTWHVQLAPGVEPDETRKRRLAELAPAHGRPDHVRLWPYHQFPFGMTLDYERKFRYS